MKEYLGRNTKRIKKEKDNPKIEDAYAYHNLGPKYGKVFMNADEKAPIGSVLPEEVIKANPQLYDFNTIGEARKALKEMLKKGGDNFDFTPDVQDLFKEE